VSRASARAQAGLEASCSRSRECSLEVFKSENKSLFYLNQMSTAGGFCLDGAFSECAV
jgi:hypothetical protein